MRDFLLRISKNHVIFEDFQWEIGNAKSSDPVQTGLFWTEKDLSNGLKIQSWNAVRSIHEHFNRSKWRLFPKKISLASEILRMFEWLYNDNQFKCDNRQNVQFIYHAVGLSWSVSSNVIEMGNSFSLNNIGYINYIGDISSDLYQRLYNITIYLSWKVFIIDLVYWR